MASVQEEVTHLTQPSVCKTSGLLNLEKLPDITSGLLQFIGVVRSQFHKSMYHYYHYTLRWSQRVSTDKFSESKLRLFNLKEGEDACPNHTDDGMHSDHGYLDICNNPLGPP